MKLIVNSIILRLLGAASVDAIMSSFTRTVQKLEELHTHELAVSDALDAKASDLEAAARAARNSAFDASDRAWEAKAKAQRIKELIG